jgi:hypothetical protein
MGTCLFAKPLLSSGCCIFAYLAVVAQQRVYRPQYYNYREIEWGGICIFTRLLPCIDAGLATGQSPVQGTLPDLYKQHRETRKSEGFRPHWSVVLYEKVSFPIFILENNLLAGLKGPWSKFIHIPGLPGL